MTESLRCFQHCQGSINIICFRLPPTCPLCGGDVMATESRIPPYIIPSPFVNAKEYPLSIVIKPTNGTFLRDYNEHSNLHIGLTNSRGHIYDYDEDGVNYNSPSWDQCLAVPTGVSDRDQNICSRWDQLLQSSSYSPNWSRNRYNEDAYNCFDYVINVLWNFGLHRYNPSLSTKSSLCQNLVLPQTKKAASYITLYREICRQGYVCQPAT